MNKSSKTTIKKENNIKAFCIFLSEMSINEETKITNIHNKTGMHVNTVKDMIDAYETIKEAAKIEIIRDKNDKIKRIVRVKEEDKDLIFKKEMRDGMAIMNNRSDEIDKKLKEMKELYEKLKEILEQKEQ